MLASVISKQKRTHSQALNHFLACSCASRQRKTWCVQSKNKKLSGLYLSLDNSRQSFSPYNAVGTSTHDVLGPHSPENVKPSLSKQSDTSNSSSNLLCFWAIPPKASSVPRHWCSSHGKRLGIVMASARAPKRALRTWLGWVALSAWPLGHL